jgi:hypothetical protein
MIAVASAAAIMSQATTVLGHGGATSLVVNPRTWVGGSVTVRGDLPTTDSVEALLVDSAGTEVSLGSVTDPPNGHFEAVFALPTDIAPGSWILEARATGMAPVRATLLVDAARPAWEVDQEAEPYPGGAPRAVVDPGFGGRATDAATRSSSPLMSDVDVVPLAAVGLALTGLAVLLLRIRRPTAIR